MSQRALTPQHLLSGRRVVGVVARLTVAVVLLLVTGSATRAATPPAASCPYATTPITSGDRPAMRAAVVCLINAQRVAHHLPRLVADAKLDLSAQRWTDVMVREGNFSHGAAFAARITAAGFDWTDAGENIATGYTTPQAVVAAWMHSPGHCANILDPAYREVGTGVADADIRGSSNTDGTWTQDFGRLMGQPALSDDDGPAQACYR